jgi:hypothetical protein
MNVINPCSYKGEHKAHDWRGGRYEFHCRGLSTHVLALGMGATLVPYPATGEVVDYPVHRGKPEHQRGRSCHEPFCLLVWAVIDFNIVLSLQLTNVARELLSWPLALQGGTLDDPSKEPQAKSPEQEDGAEVPSPTG